MNNKAAKPRTNREKRMVSCAYNTGKYDGLEQGKTQGALAERKAIQQDMELCKVQAATDLLAKAAHFQECITKLILSINRDL